MRQEGQGQRHPCCKTCCTIDSVSLSLTGTCTVFGHRLQGIQAMLQLPRPALLQLLCTAPSLVVSGPKAVEEQLQRVAWGLGVSAAGLEAAQLLQLLPTLGIDALLDPLLAVQKVSCNNCSICV